MLDDFYAFLLQRGLAVFGLGLLLHLLIAAEIGYRFGLLRRRRRQPDEPETGQLHALTAGMLGLLAFTLGLTISFAQNRFETRRELVVTEANAIGTAWLRARVVEGEAGAALTGLIEDYAKTRLNYTIANTRDGEWRLLARTSALQAQIWPLVQAEARRAPNPVSVSLMASVNDMFDASLAQRFAFESRIPTDLAWMLLAGALIAAGAMGYQVGLSGTRPLVMMLLLLVMWSGGMVLIADLTRPRLGAIRADASPLIWTIQGFGSGTPAR